MTIKSIIRQATFKQHILLEKLDACNELKEFIRRFKSKYVSCDLIRIGGDGDGGYLLPNNLNDIEFCFSPGVDYTAKFEHELSSSYGIKSFMADASVNASPIADDNLHFIPKFLGSRTFDKFITLSDWVQKSIGNSNGARILQMDVEGGEYDVLTYESSETLSQFSTMIIEFHGLQRLFQSNFLMIFSSIFEKIYSNFSICHVHPNNCCGTAKLREIEVPHIIEVTFIRNDLIPKLSRRKKISLPHPLDRKNVEANLDIRMPEIWWKRK